MAWDAEERPAGGHLCAVAPGHALWTRRTRPAPPCWTSCTTAPMPNNVASGQLGQDADDCAQSCKWGPDAANPKPPVSGGRSRPRSGTPSPLATLVICARRALHANHPLFLDWRQARARHACMGHVARANGVYAAAPAGRGRLPRACRRTCVAKSWYPSRRWTANRCPPGTTPPCTPTAPARAGRRRPLRDMLHRLSDARAHRPHPGGWTMPA